MNITFRPILYKPWTLKDDEIIYKKKSIPISLITSATLYSIPKNSSQNGVIGIVCCGKTFLLPFPYEQSQQGVDACKYIREKSKEPPKPGAVTANSSAAVLDLPKETNYAGILGIVLLITIISIIFTCSLSMCDGSSSSSRSSHSTGTTATHYYCGFCGKDMGTAYWDYFDNKYVCRECSKKYRER